VVVVMMVAAVVVHRYYEQVQDHVHPCPITRGWMMDGWTTTNLAETLNPLSSTFLLSLHLPCPTGNVISAFYYGLL
jgi:hypothetical protein